MHSIHTARCPAYLGVAGYYLDQRKIVWLISETVD